VADAKRRPNETHESYVERMIRDAQEEGAFDHLSCAGKPLPLTGGELPEAWWIKEKMKREKLSSLPESIAIRYEAEAVLESLARETDEQVVREQLLAVNARIRRLNATYIGVGPPTTLAPFDVEAVVRRWRSGATAAAAAR
jgi:Domain of unknown function (DUF1992)